jgi:hypothetical protein
LRTDAAFLAVRGGFGVLTFHHGTGSLNLDFPFWEGFFLLVVVEFCKISAAMVVGVRQ